MSLTTISRSRCFGGTQATYSHASAQTRCTMRFALYLPPAAERETVPLIYWLSGLTCTEENFTTKAGAQRIASELGLALAIPDTSPRGERVPDEPDRYDVGIGAGFYVDATEPPWDQPYRMYSYVTEELPALLAANFPVDPSRVGIFGHSMGGHGALTIAVRNPAYFKSVSAFAPIASAARCPWGEAALGAYLGADPTAWRDYDASLLIESRGWGGPPILVDQGGADPFLAEQLKPQLLQEACARAGVGLRLRMHDGYDHSYYFIATFIEDHLRFHVANLGAEAARHGA